MEKEEFSVVKKQLNALIALNLLTLSNKQEKMDLRSQISFLSRFGFKSAEIADILGKTVVHISKEISILKKIIKK